jgi:hypothetical protein
MPLGRHNRISRYRSRIATHECNLHWIECKSPTSECKSHLTGCNLHLNEYYMHRIECKRASSVGMFHSMPAVCPPRRAFSPPTRAPQATTSAARQTTGIFGAATTAAAATGGVHSLFSGGEANQERANHEKHEIDETSFLFWLFLFFSFGFVWDLLFITGFPSRPSQPRCRPRGQPRPASWPG